MISDALLRLLQNQSLDAITVSQITTEARIGRNTFYNHFQKKEDILDHMMVSIFEGVREKLRQIDNPSIRDFLIWRFAFIQQNPLMSVFHRHNDIKRLLMRFRERNASMLTFATVNDPYQKEFFQGGMDYVTSRWITEGMKESPEEMTDKMLRYMHRVG